MVKTPRKNDAWPVGTEIQFVDAWGNGSYVAKVVSVKCDDFSLCADDARGVRYHLHTDRITATISKEAVVKIPKFDFSDLL